MLKLLTMSGAFIYEYGDHGGLVVMADDVRKTKLVREPKRGGFEDAQPLLDDDQVTGQKTCP